MTRSTSPKEDSCERGVTMTRWSLQLTTALALGSAGCSPQSANMTPSPGGEGLVKGSVSYRERVALPPDAIVEIWIIDVSPMIVAAVVIAQTTIPSAGRQVPILFELRYDPSRIEPSHTYGIRAVIRSGGRMLFATDTARHVITQGSPTQVELWLKGVGDESGSDSEARGLVGPHGGWRTLAVPVSWIGWKPRWNSPSRGRCPGGARAIASWERSRSPANQ